MGEFDQGEIPKPVSLQENVTDRDGIEKDTKFQARAVFDKVADFCNQLPFAGKIIIAPIATSMVQEKNPYYKTIKTIEAAGTLGVMLWGHSTQIGMGLNRLGPNLEILKHDPSPEKLLACSLDVAYTAANVAATYAQLHLGGRLAEHFIKTKSKSVPRLSGWGINGSEVDYELVAENLMTAIVNDDQGDIDTFFMILPKEQKQRVMESVKAITKVVDETYSYDEIDQKISQLDQDIEKKSKFRYIIDIVKNTHKVEDLTNYASHYSFKEKMEMFITTLSSQIGFLGWG
jgi:hypothetical protein